MCGWRWSSTSYGFQFSGQTLTDAFPKWPNGCQWAAPSTGLRRTILQVLISLQDWALQMPFFSHWGWNFTSDEMLNVSESLVTTARPHSTESVGPGLLRSSLSDLANLQQTLLSQRGEGSLPAHDWLWFQRASHCVKVVSSGLSPCFPPAPQQASTCPVYNHAFIRGQRVS